MILRQKKVIYFANDRYLSYVLTDKYPPDHRLLIHISTGIRGLDEKDIIQICQSDSKSEWIINIESMVNKDTDAARQKKDYYTAMDESEVHTILMSNPKHYPKAISLLRFYVYVLSTLIKKEEKRKGVGFTSVKDMVGTIGCNEKTILSYLKQLEEMNLIYVYRPKAFIRYENGDISEISHTYGRFCDKDKIMQIGKEHEETYGTNSKSEFKRIRKENGDKTRSYSQKYNRLVDLTSKGSECPYSYDECKEIYAAMQELNQRYKNRPEREKDLSVFNKFNFYESG